MKRSIEIIAQVIPAALLLINFFVPTDIFSDARLSYFLFLIKNSMFEIICLSIIVVFFLSPLKERWLNNLKNNLDGISKESSIINKTLMSLMGFALPIISLLLITHIYKERRQHFSNIKQRFYYQALYEAEFLSKQGHLNAAINSYSSFGVSLYNENLDRAGIIKDKIDRISYRKKLSESYYKKFNKSFNEHGLTRVNFAVLLESYFLNPFDPIIEDKAKESFEYLMEGIGNGKEYYHAVLAKNVPRIKQLDEEYGHIFIENGIIDKEVYSENYYQQLYEVIGGFKEEEYMAYLHSSWRTNAIKRNFLTIKNNKEASL